MSTSSTNSWLRAQRKSELIEIAENTGYKNYDGLKKVELEAALDDYLAANTTRLSGKSDLQGYYNSRSRALGSPLKKEAPSIIKDEAEKGLRSVKKRVSKASDDITSAAETAANRASSSAIVQTPGRTLSQVAARMPTTPADIAHAVDRSAVAVRQRAASIYQESGIDEITQSTRASLSTVHSIVVLVSLFELYFIRKEILSDRYAFTVPAVKLIGTSDYPVYLPDMFLLLTSSFWSPALTWALTSFVLPPLFGYFFNLSASNAASHPRTRTRANEPNYRIDPLTFSIAKALISFVVYGQGANLCGLLSGVSIERLNTAVYGGYKGILTGAAITGLSSIYDAILRK